MRGGTRRRHAEDEEESAFVSMTDMTVSFLFIVMILLAFFASQFDDAAEKVPKAWLDQAVTERDEARVEAARLADRLAEAERQMQLLRSAVSALEADKARLQGDLDRANARIAELEAEIARLRERLRRLEIRDPLEAYITQGAEARRRLLETLRDQLKLRFPDLLVVISEESDALRFQGDGLFDRGQSALRPDKRDIVDAVAEQLERVLPCYTLGPAAGWREDCNPAGSVIEAVQIEGHTDTDGSAISNLRLSTARANETFVAMTARAPGLVEHLNIRDQPVISVAGYGEMRPVAANDTAANKATNRRIDLRIIMYVPQQSEEIDRIRSALQAGIAGADQ
jgi:outer membrane protein OmpA-like peptidoglycan-associated protein